MSIRDRLILWLNRHRRRVPHGYALLASGAVSVAVIVWQLVPLGPHQAFAAGGLVVIYLAFAVAVVTRIPRDRL
jgi:hypothetical protein